MDLREPSRFSGRLARLWLAAFVALQLAGLWQCYVQPNLERFHGG